MTNTATMKQRWEAVMMNNYGTPPVALASGDGALVTDVDGKTYLDLLGGIDFNHSSFSTPLIRDSAEAYWGNDYNYKLSASTSLSQGFRMFNDLSNMGTYRMNFDVGASTKFTKWFTWNLSVSDRYLNHPAPGRKTNDLLYTTGLGFTFAQ